MLFADRVEAGRRLAERLAHLAEQDVVVLGLPRGGVPVAFEVATALGAPLDVLVVRKLGVPFQPELALGAIGEGDVRVINDAVLAEARVTPEELSAVEQYERQELARRVVRFRGDRPKVPVTGRTALIVDDGIATGATARAACRVARAQGATRVILAAPVAPPDAAARFADDADEVLFLQQPAAFFAIGQFYADFSQTSDEEVVALLNRAAAPAASPERAGTAPSAPADPPDRDEEVRVTAGRAEVYGHLTIPAQARGVVVFAHGTGSSRHSPRNRFVAAVLNEAGLGTLLFDLLTPEEEYDRANVFDIDLLARRLTEVTAWLCAEPGMEDARVGYFGASTGAAAALWAAAEPGADIGAVVSRGGRPDLAGPRLAEVRAPTLLIVGERDEVVLDLNRDAEAKLRCEVRLAVVPGATHLFSEPGTLEAAAHLARGWFIDHLAAART